ncbi:MAG TPA: FHA domain-containing protein [Anaerolineales bacterium]|nr:FHA domain-containing protein [Anaerolineales bacterium]
MMLILLQPSENLIDSFLTWLVGHQFIITLVVLSLLAILLVLVAIRLFRQSSPRVTPAKTHPRTAASRSSPAPVSGSSTWQLVGANGQIIPLEPLPFTIGRQADNTLVLDDPSIALQHARIHLDATWKGLIIEDLDSPAGIQVDGKPTRKNLLQPGVRLEIGSYTFKLNQKTS